MRAAECPFFTACQQQLTENAKRRAAGQVAVPCWAEKVSCDEYKTDMEQRCCRLTNLLVRLEVAKNEREGNRSQAGVATLVAFIVITLQLTACAAGKPVSVVPDHCDSQDCNVGKTPR
jgi:hypothetical protein